MPLHSDRTQSLEKGQRTTSRAATVHAYAQLDLNKKNKKCSAI
jgi:hypothetical protein